MSVKYRKLDSNGDYSFGFGNNNFYTDLQAVTQAIQTKLNMFEGEWWESITEGLPFFQSVAGKSGSENSIAAIDLIFQNRILETTGVNSIASYTSNYDSTARKYTASAKVNTIYGTTEVTTA